jgi:GNAT superfamily N-acetyltransferase
MSELKIRPVSSKKEMGDFIRLPWKIYKDDPRWVPPLRMQLRKMFDSEKNPFFEHANVEFFLCREGKEFVGRIAAILNKNHNDFHNEKAGFFGFFESIQNEEVANALLDTASKWVKEKGMELIRGPMSYSTNEECGFLVEGFDSSPMVMMPYNPQYYLELVEKHGFHKSKDLLAYAAYRQKLPERLQRSADLIRKRKKINVRSLNLKDFDKEVERLKGIYNSAWMKNWGFVPMTDNEFTHMAKDLKSVVDPDLALIAEINGEPVGFSLALPDINQALIKINGRLFPFGIVKLLWYMRKVDTFRVITLGVKEPYRKIGIEGLFYFETFRRGLDKGYQMAEMSWVLEDNVLMSRGIESIGAKLYKRYRIYEKTL